MNKRSLLAIAASCLLFSIRADAVQMTINEDSATRFDYHAYWGDGLGIASASSGSVAMIGMTGRPYGAEARIEADAVLLGFGSIVTYIPVNFSFEALPVIDPDIPHQLTAWVSGALVVAGYWLIDADLHGARFILGEQLPSSVPDAGSLLVPFGLALVGCFWFKRRYT